MTAVLLPLHGIASRQDLPLPFRFVVVGAALALIISFVVLIFAWRTPRFSTLRGVPLPRLTTVVDHPAVLLGCTLADLGGVRYRGAGGHGWAGPADQPELRFRFRLDVGRAGADLAAPRLVLAGDQPAPDRSCRTLRTRTHRHPGRPDVAAEADRCLAGRLGHLRFQLA